jgi:hypothetical protein
MAVESRAWSRAVGRLRGFSTSPGFRLRFSLHQIPAGAPHRVRTIGRCRSVGEPRREPTRNAPTPTGRRRRPVRGHVEWASNRTIERAASALVVEHAPATTRGH